MSECERERESACFHKATTQILHVKKKKKRKEKKASILKKALDWFDNYDNLASKFILMTQSYTQWALLMHPSRPLFGTTQ